MSSSEDESMIDVLTCEKPSDNFQHQILQEQKRINLYLDSFLKQRRNNGKIRKEKLEKIDKLGKIYEIYAIFVNYQLQMLRINAQIEEDEVVLVNKKKFDDFSNAIKNSMRIGQIQKYTGFQKDVFMELLDVLPDRPREKGSKEVRVAIFLMFMKMGPSQQSLAVLTGLSQSTIYRIISKYNQDVSNLASQFISWPTFSEIREAEKVCMSKSVHLRAFGCLDGKHWQINHPPHSGALFHNYKGYFIEFHLFEIVSLNSAAKWILKNTLVSNESLTPQIKLRLITIASPLWMSTPDQCPLPDPYWAFYWPGGQGLTRYILENPRMFSNASILDFGAGCGSASIAAMMIGARKILANDIDKYALLSTKLNFHLNQISDSKILYSADNFLENPNNLLNFFQSSSQNNFILLGDMFYDSDFAEILFSCLKNVQKSRNVRVLVGDPDRHPLAENDYLKRYKTKFVKTQLHEYQLPGYVIKEHYGFNTAKIFELDFS